jgi:hypothetical protein
MKKVLVLLAVFLDGLAVGLVVGLLLPAEQRDRLSRQLMDFVGEVREYLPDG